ncbi:MAG TPA: ferritin-like domain-containing protein [Terriglobales bacterium]|nr:ferritin-like domain-containing protein [Terriglobales bacterium]
MKENSPAAVQAETPSASTQESIPAKTKNLGRRSFLKGAGMTSIALSASALLLNAAQAEGKDDNGKKDQNDNDNKGQDKASNLTAGDVAILRFLAAAELLEADLWQQYAELGGVTSGRQNQYQKALQRLDGDGSQYITSNTLDELSHAEFLNAYLLSKGAEPVDLDVFRTLPSSQASGAQQTGRLTNLMNLTVDTSWYTRYRSTDNPDLGATFPQAIDLVNVPAIPRNDDDFGPKDHVQAIANTAAFHFGMIEQGGSTLYSAMVQKASNLEVLRIVVSIGGDEVAHFLEWVDFAGNGVQTPIAPFTDPTNGLTFPDFNATGNPELQTNLIFPVPCEFISAKLPHCAVIRPTSPKGIAMGVVNFLTGTGLFTGQSPAFFKALATLARQADAAQRGF